MDLENEQVRRASEDEGILENPDRYHYIGEAYWDEYAHEWVILKRKKGMVYCP